MQFEISIWLANKLITYKFQYQYRQTYALRACLRFMRECDSAILTDVCNTIETHTGITMEQDVLKRLRTSIVCCLVTL
jgi:hypothetical protein